MLEAVVTQFVRRNLRGVWVRGHLLPGPTVWAANHHSWWDPFVGTAFSRSRGGRSAVLMLQENLERFPFARAIGAFGTGEPREGLRYLDAGRHLIVYPEGELRPGGPPGDLAAGAAWFACAAKVPLYALASRTLLRGQQHPEAYLVFDRVDTGGSRSEVTRRLGTHLAKSLSELDELVAHTDPRQPLPGFTLAVAGRRSPEERIETLTRRLTWRG
jgi:hypothetical protein